MVGAIIFGLPVQINEQPVKVQQETQVVNTFFDNQCSIATNTKASILSTDGYSTLVLFLKTDKNLKNLVNARNAKELTYMIRFSQLKKVDEKKLSLEE